MRVLFRWLDTPCSSAANMTFQMPMATLTQLQTTWAAGKSLEPIHHLVHLAPTIVINEVKTLCKWPYINGFHWGCNPYKWSYGSTKTIIHPQKRKETINSKAPNKNLPNFKIAVPLKQFILNKPKKRSPPTTRNNISHRKHIFHISPRIGRALRRGKWLWALLEDKGGCRPQTI